MRSAKKQNLRSRNAFGRAGNRPSSLCPCLLYQTFPGTKFLPHLVQSFGTNFVLPTDFMVQFFSGTIFLVQFLFLVQKRSDSRSASGARFAFGQRVRPFPICVRAHLCMQYVAHVRRQRRYSTVAFRFPVKHSFLF